MKDEISQSTGVLPLSIVLLFQAILFLVALLLPQSPVYELYRDAYRHSQYVALVAIVFSEVWGLDDNAVITVSYQFPRSHHNWKLTKNVKTKLRRRMWADEGD